MNGQKECVKEAYLISRAQIIMSFTIVHILEINYNFNRNHMSLGKKTPAEVAIPQLELGVNKWLDLIKLSNI